MLAFVPLSRGQVGRLGAGDRLDAHAWTLTPAFLASFGFADADEDAERTALYWAGLDALRAHGRRLVAVVETDARPDADGAVALTGLKLPQVSSLFADEDASASLVAAVASRPHQSLDECWGSPAHEALLEGADLLWFGPEEWEQLSAD